MKHQTTLQHGTTSSWQRHGKYVPLSTQFQIANSPQQMVTKDPK